MIIDQRQIRQVYLVCGKTDLRRGIDGLAGVVQDQFELDPYNQALYLFCGTRKDRFKALYWDGDGFLLLYKRIENGRLSHSIQVTKAEADEAKQKAQDSTRSSQEAQRVFLAKSKSIDQLINQKASEKTREAKNELEINYQSMTKQTKAILAIPTVYRGV